MPPTPKDTSQESPPSHPPAALRFTTRRREMTDAELMRGMNAAFWARDQHGLSHNWEAVLSFVRPHLEAHGIELAREKVAGYAEAANEELRTRPGSPSARMWSEVAGCLSGILKSYAARHAETGVKP